MDENKVQDDTNLSKREKADMAAQDIAEVSTKALARRYGGALGGAVADKLIDTKIGQQTMKRVSKQFTSNPLARTALANNQGKISESKPMISSAVNSLASLGSSQSDAGINNETSSSGKGTGDVSNLVGKVPNKFKLAIIAGVAGLFFAMIFIVVIFTPLINLGIVDLGGSGGTGNGSYFGYSSVSSKYSHWWPIGSSETTTVSGVTLATGTPLVTLITSEYHAHEEFRDHTHNGIDIGNGNNGAGVVNIIATKAGTVIYPINSSQTNFGDNGYKGNPDGGGFGNYVLIQHSDGTVTAYAHMAKNSINVFKGDSVRQGQVIGKMGNSGSSTGTHLHFEVRVNGSRVNPLNYVSNANPRPNRNNITTVNGISNKNTTCLTLSANKLSKNAVAAILTNINYQNNFNIGASDDSYGLYKWSSGRYDNLKTSFPDTYNTIDSQIKFLMYELENEYTDLYNLLNDQNTSLEDLTYNFCAKYGEVENTETVCKERSKNYEEYYQYVINGCK